MKEVLYILLSVFELFLAAYAIYTIGYTFINSFAGLFRKKRIFPPATFQRKFAVLIPAYKEDSVIVSVAEDALKQKYPAEKYDVIVIADSLQAKTIATLKELPIKLIEVSFEKSTKVKALNFAFDKLSDTYDAAVILDADNIMDRDCLDVFNNAMDAGYKSIQGKRTAKNKNSSFAVLDGISELINNHIYRKGQNALGLSASLIGSGMAFDYKLLTSTLKEMNSVGGFDREMEVRLIGKGVKTYYLESAVVYDEKIDNAKNFGNQRTRWIAAQYIYLYKYFFKGMKALLKGDVVYFNSSVLRNIQLPRIINLGLLGIWVAFVLIFNSLFPQTYKLWLSGYLLYLSAFVLAIPPKKYNKDFFVSLAQLPQAFIIMALCFFKLRTASDKFIHTPHNFVDTDGIKK